eukprot:8545414-Alexandrium_andersonii.AAC.1
MPFHCSRSRPFTRTSAKKVFNARRPRSPPSAAAKLVPELQHHRLHDLRAGGCAAPVRLPQARLHELSERRALAEFEELL